MKNLKIIICFCVILLSAHSIQGGSGLQLGSRPQGMGGAFVALSDDANAVYWNPSGLGQLRSGEATFMHWTFAEIENIMVDYVSAVYPLPMGGFGCSWIRQSANLEEGREHILSTMSENRFTLSYGLNVIQRFALGVSFSRIAIDSKAGNEGSTNFEIGGLYYLDPGHRWSVAAMAKDIPADFNNQYMRPYYLFGMAHRAYGRDGRHYLALTCDVQINEGIDNKKGKTIGYAAGLEYLLRIGSSYFSLRGGGGNKDYAFGLGLRVGYFSIDYAYVRMREETIGDSHKFGISFHFGRPAPASAEPPAAREPSTSITPRDMRLSGVLRGNSLSLEWTPVPGCEGYVIQARISGRDWHILNAEMLTRTQTSVANNRTDVKIQFRVIAMVNGNVVGQSNILEVN